MDGLTNKTILVISPQSWGSMFVAKHHYAIELAKLGNDVYFLNPPREDKFILSSRRKRISIRPSGVESSLSLIWHELYFPYKLKFHAKNIFNALMRKQVRDIISLIGKPIDIVWSFDLGNLYPFSNFPQAFKIFHPVDEPQNAEAIKAAKNADILFSVTKEIIEKYRHLNVPGHFINHGVSEYFFDQSHVQKNGSLRVGISGNLLRPDVDWETLLTIIREHPSIIFEIWGNYDLAKSNLGGGYNESVRKSIDALNSAPNVKLHGPISSQKLPVEFKRMDAFLICYDVQKDQSKGTNYHKILEYMSTGKVIISNNVSTYKDHPDLVQMINERDHNRSLPQLFKQVIGNLQKYNSPELEKHRIDFAAMNKYHNQLKRIEGIIYGSKG